MIVTKGATSVTTYVMLVDSAAGTPETAYTITNLDLQYTRNQSTAEAKVDATALGAANSAWSANKAIEVDATSSPGLYRVDWPDAAFASGADKVILVVTGTGLAPAVIMCELVNYNTQDGVRMGLTSLPNAAADAAGGLPISDAGGLDLDAKLANTNEVTAARMGALTDWINGGRLDLILDDILLDTGTTLDGRIPTLLVGGRMDASVGAMAANVITAAATHTDFGAEIADAVWDEAIAGHAGAGSTGEALSAASSAGDPWTTALPGAYGAGTAGKIVGDNVNATISSRATQTSVDDVPTATENADALLTRQMTQSYAANGIAPTFAQAQFAIHQMLMTFAISGTTYTVKQLDGVTTAFVATLNDAVTPTAITRS